MPSLTRRFTVSLILRSAHLTGPEVDDRNCHPGLSALLPCMYVRITLLQRESTVDYYEHRPPIRFSRLSLSRASMFAG